MACADRPAAMGFVQGNDVGLFEGGFESSFAVIGLVFIDGRENDIDVGFRLDRNNSFEIEDVAECRCAPKATVLEPLRDDLLPALDFPHWPLLCGPIVV